MWLLRWPPTTPPRRREGTDVRWNARFREGDANGDGPGADRSVYLYHVVDNEQTMRNYGHQAVVWQTTINPVVALELLALGLWNGAGVLAPKRLTLCRSLNL